MLPIRRPSSDLLFATAPTYSATPSVSAQANGYVKDGSGVPQIPILEWDNWRAQMAYKWQQQYKTEIDYVTKVARRWSINFNHAEANAGVGVGLNIAPHGEYALESATAHYYTGALSFGIGVSLNTTGAANDYAYITTPSQHDFVGVNTPFRFSGSFCEAENCGMIVGYVDPTATPMDPLSTNPIGGSAYCLAFWYNPAVSANIQIILGMGTGQAGDYTAYDTGVPPLKPYQMGYVSTAYELVYRQNDLDTDTAGLLEMYVSGELVYQQKIEGWVGGGFWGAPFYGIKAATAEVKRLRLHASNGERVPY